jgi:hypothetical protein
MVKLKNFSESDKGFIADMDYHIFGIYFLGYVFKVYYYQKFLEIVVGSFKKGKTITISSKKRYLEVYGEI